MSAREAADEGFVSSLTLADVVIEKAFIEEGTLHSALRTERACGRTCCAGRQNAFCGQRSAVDDEDRPLLLASSYNCLDVVVAALSGQ